MVDSPINVVNLLVIVDIGIVVSSVSASVLGTMVVVSTDPYDELGFNDVKTVASLPIIVPVEPEVTTEVPAVISDEGVLVMPVKIPVTEFRIFIYCLTLKYIVISSLQVDSL